MHVVFIAIPMTVFADGEAKSAMFQQRYNMIHQNLLLDSRFSDVSRGSRGADFPMISTDPAAEKVRMNEPSLFEIHEGPDSNWRFQLTPPESLSGSRGVKVVFGMLTRGSDGKLYIEDNHQAAEVRFSTSQLSMDCVTENMFVVVKGEVIDDVFHAFEITVPPIPQRSLCESALNVGGANCDLATIHVSSGPVPANTSIAILSNVLLDSPIVLEKLHSLFGGLEECNSVPSMYVLMGNFVSQPFDAFTGDSYRHYQKVFERFAQLLARHPATLEKTKIVLVPGMNEPGNGVFPQPPLSDILLRGIASRFPNIVLSSNPCRIQFYDKSVVLFANNIAETLKHDKLHDSATKKVSKSYLTKSLLSQMTLVPGIVRNKAVIWDMDTSMRIYPPPDALFLFDKGANSYTEEVHKETLFTCLPAFAKSETVCEGEFHIYSPCQKQTTISVV